jgi:hypothetical protein
MVALRFSSSVRTNSCLNRDGKKTLRSYDGRPSEIVLEKNGKIFPLASEIRGSAYNTLKNKEPDDYILKQKAQERYELESGRPSKDLGNYTPGNDLESLSGTRDRANTMLHLPLPRHIEDFSAALDSGSDMSSVATDPSQSRRKASTDDVTICPHCNKGFTGTYRRDDLARHIHQQHTENATHLSQPFEEFDYDHPIISCREPIAELAQPPAKEHDLSMPHPLSSDSGYRMNRNLMDHSFTPDDYRPSRGYTDSIPQESLQVLESAFTTNPYPSLRDISLIATRTQLEPDTIRDWFSKQAHRLPDPISVRSDIQYMAGWLENRVEHVAESGPETTGVASLFAGERQNRNDCPIISPHMSTHEKQPPKLDYPTSSDSDFILGRFLLEPELTPALTQPPAKARDFSGMNHLPSDSDYQSGIGTDTESVISDILTGSSLVVSADMVHDFVAFFGDTLIKKAGAQQWAQFAMAHNPQSEIEKRLTALLRAFAIDLAARRSTSMALDDGKVHPVHDDESVRVLLDGAIKLVRRYRPMIARYFLENSINDKAEAVSLSDRLQGLGRHFSLAERVDLLVHRGVRDVDEGDKGDEDEDDNVVDEDIVPQLEPVQAMLVSGDAFRHLASELRRSLYRDDSYGMTTIRNVVLKSVTSSNTSTPCWATATFLAKWDVMRFMRSQYSKIPSVASVLVLTGSALYAQATTCGEYVRKHWPTTGSIFLDILDKVLVSDADRTATIELGMSTPYRQQYRP